MANPQPTDAHLRVAHSITEAIMLRNFTKRQRTILDLILRLSWGCHKKEAIIPHKNDFAIVGIGKTHINNELQWLQESKIIYIEGDRYSFNKDFDQWQVSRVNPYDPEKLTELVTINLNGSYQIGNPNDTEGYQNSNSGYQNGNPSDPKSYRKGNREVTKKVTTPTIIIKEKYKENNTGNNYSSNNKYVGINCYDENFATVCKLWESEMGIMLTPGIGERLQAITDEYPIEWIKDAITEAVKHNKRNEKYVEAILKRWKADGKQTTKRIRKVPV